MTKYFFLFLMVYGMQAIRVADDIEHFKDSEKCKPCYHHRLLKTEFKPEQHNSGLNNSFTYLV